MMGKDANRGVLFELDASLQQAGDTAGIACARGLRGWPTHPCTDSPVSAGSHTRPRACPQVLQELINVLPVSANIPSAVDVELQTRVARLFQNEANVNRLLPSFINVAKRMRQRWLDDSPRAPLRVFNELSEYVM